MPMRGKKYLHKSSNDTDASNLEVKSLLKLIMNECEEKQVLKTGFGFR